MMDSFVWEWLSLALRLLHVITAIAWIGASFYFVWLDNSLAPPPADKQAHGVVGDLWAFHGGGIYEVAKYRLAPPVMPEKLHWFKWEAYSTWITGALLLMAVYYLRAELYLVDADKWLTSNAAAIVGSVVFLCGGVLLYEALLRVLAARDQRLFIAAWVVLVVSACWLADRLFSDRAAFLHVGAMLASVMAANVWLGIIPAQKGFMRTLTAGGAPDPVPMRLAKLRSVHNNYLTLPVLLAMLSNHYAFLYGHPYGWLLLAAAMAVLAWARHFFNLRHSGQVRWSILVTAAAATGVLAVLSGAPWEQRPPAAARSPGDVEFSLIAQHCAVCHAERPAQPGFSAAPAGISLQTLEQIEAVRPQAATAVASGYMPLGNVTGLTEEQRIAIVKWLQ